MLNAERIIKFFAMKPLPNEGGYYVETYRAGEKIPQVALPQRYPGDRNFSTAILYLITSDKFSALHRVKSDEIFHFYLGGPVAMLQLAPDGSSRTITLGCDITAGQCLQAVVSAGTWQGCLLKEGEQFALIGCTVAPGFEFEDFELADTEELLNQYPDQRDLILKLTPKNQS